MTIEDLIFNRELYLFLAKESDSKKIRRNALKVVRNIDKILELVLPDDNKM